MSQLREEIERAGEFIREFEKTFRLESINQQKNNLDPYRHYLLSNKKRGNKIYKDLNKERNVLSFRMNYQFLFKYKHFQAIVHAFQSQDIKKINRFKYLVLQTMGQESQ